MKKKLLLYILISAFLLTGAFINVSDSAYAANGTWKQNGKKWWYSYSDGAYPKDKWEKISGKWYHFDKWGYMQIGWQEISGNWYYLGTNGIMRTGWEKISGKWYYFDKNGVMQTGWKLIGNKWYYFKNGIMKTGWMQSGSKWYYFDKNGVMATGTKKIGNKTYVFNAEGVLEENKEEKITVRADLIEFKNKIEPALKESLSNYTIDIDGDNVTIIEWSQGIASAVDSVLKYPSYYRSTWIRLRDSFEEMSRAQYEVLLSMGIYDANVMVYLVNEYNHSKAFLGCKNGVLILDVASNIR